ncbi:MAG: NIPSNAP family protein [Candidatus Dormibacteraceae bacterium]
MSDQFAPCAVVELRRYTLHPGRREELIELFEREFVESQEAAGMRLIGQFRDLDDPDRFVWLRAFPDMESRGRALAAFYDGPIWARHRDAANATMVDSDDVLLLRAASGPPAFGRPVERPPLGAGAGGPSPVVVVATICPLPDGPDERFVEFFDDQVRPLLLEAGGLPIACLRTEVAANTFPRLPVRTDEHVFLWLAAFPTEERYREHLAELERSATWAQVVRPELERRLAGPARRLRLQPTARSLLGQPGDAHDFDFVAGRWTVANRRLRRRGQGCDEWDEFPGTHHGWLLLGGIANVDEMACPARGFSGMSVRAFDPAAGRWSISWISSLRGVPEPPLVGDFCGDHGEFFGDDVDEGRPVRVRFRWDRVGADAARWAQAFSYAGGPWETNWVMEFSRPPSG